MGLHFFSWIIEKNILTSPIKAGNRASNSWGVVLHLPQSLISSSGGTTPFGPIGPSAVGTWCFTSRKALFLRPEAPRHSERIRAVPGSVDSPESVNKNPPSKRTFEGGFLFYHFIRLLRLHANLPILPCGQDSRSAAFASFAGRHPGAAFPAPELSSLLRSSLVLTRLSRLLSHCFFSPQSWQCSIRCIRRSPRAQTRLRFSSAQSSGASSKLTRLRAAS